MAREKFYEIVSTNPGILAQKVNSDGSLKIFRLHADEPQVVGYYHPQEVDEAQVAGAISTSKSLSSITGNSAATSDGLAIIGVVLSADQSGATLKFS
jgi:hypothetical protein